MFIQLFETAKAIKMIRNHHDDNADQTAVMRAADRKRQYITRNVSEGLAKLSLAYALTLRVGILQSSARLSTVFAESLRA